MHLNAFYDLQNHTYSDAMIQPVHQKDEFRAFCDMVDRHHILPGTKDVLLVTEDTVGRWTDMIVEWQFYFFKFSKS